MSLAGILPELIMLAAGLVVGALIVEDAHIGVALLLALGSVGIVTVYTARLLAPRDEQMNMVSIAPSVFAVVVGLIVGVLIAEEALLAVVILFAMVFALLLLIYAFDLAGRVNTMATNHNDQADPPAPASNDEGDA